ncbi:MAG TPA: glycosyltransferase [Pyrinomonadaceae bacterium]|nr:glycosyltransferase [Pyrinomonadaceae bacterium]HMP66513.1 glycosyltransferase [Pyrinomonadaceae bacterium]
MARIVLATFGSFGDVHPKIALGIELKRRGHDVTIAAMEWYREKIGLIGLGFAPMAPHLDPEDTELGRELMDRKTGSERIIKDIIVPSLPEMFADMLSATEGADLLVSGEITYAASSVIEKTGIKWVSTTLSPISFFSAYDPSVPPQAPWFENLRMMPAAFHRLVLALARRRTENWLTGYRDFRRSLGLSEDHDPIFSDKFSNRLHLVMFSSVLGSPQPDWPQSALQTGFCFYDGQQDSGTMPAGLQDFLSSGEAPIVFTLGSAAVIDPGRFFEESVKAAKILRRRAVLLYGSYNEPPPGLNDEIVGYEYAPYSKVFPHAVCVVHQGGVGTTGQVLRAGAPHLIMPYSHDQPDNAARCRRAGVAEIIPRGAYNAETASKLLRRLISRPEYRDAARSLKLVVDSEGGTQMACDRIEAVIRS